MDVWVLVQALVQLCLVVAVLMLWARGKRSHEDPRISRGLQLLTTKISILEDLSDRTDTQVQQLSQLVESKNKMLQEKIIEAEQQLQRIDQSLHRTMEVAEIFQEKIPTEEVIERQNTVKYILAARMANNGISPKDIALKVDLPLEQIEFIAKINRERLMFDLDQLPPWAQIALQNQEKKMVENEMVEEESWHSEPLAPVKEAVTDDQRERLKKLGDQFKQACRDYDKQAAPGALKTQFNKVVSSAQKLNSRWLEKSQEWMETALSPGSEPLLESATENVAESLAENLAENSIAPVTADRSLPSETSNEPQEFKPMEIQSSAGAMSQPLPREKLKARVEEAKTRVLYSSKVGSAKLQMREVPAHEVKRVLFPNAD